MVVLFTTQKNALLNRHQQGHFLVAAFLMLVPMRMRLEGLSARQAVDAVLRDNLHGLEIDARCVELAAFALALAAWRYPGAGGYRILPELNVACSGLSVSVAKDEWKQLALGKHNLRLALEWMYDAFKDAPVLGSLLNPVTTDAAKIVPWEELSPALQQAFSQEQTDEQKEAAVVAQGLAKAAIVLAGQYNWVVTNVPYLARGKQNDRLRDFSEKQYPTSKNDLATVFLERCFELCVNGGTTSIVLPQNWLFLTTYKKFREKLLTNHTWHLIARLGPGAFETISGEIVKAILVTFSRGKCDGGRGSQIGNLLSATAANSRLPVAVMRAVNVSEPRSVSEKALGLRTTDIKSIEQAKQLENPDATIKLEDLSGSGFIRDYAGCYQGLTTGDDPRLKRQFWEVLPNKTDSELWKRLQGPSQGKGLFGGRENLVDARITTGELRTGALRGREAWGKKGVAIDRVASLSTALYSGDFYHSLIPVLVPKNEADLPAILAFALSDEMRNSARNTNQALSIDNGYFEKFEFDFVHWAKVAEESYPNGLPDPYSEDPMQWIFHGHPAKAEYPLQVAVARLLGYRWPAELDPSMQLSDEARSWLKKSEALLALADGDGVVCIPAVRGESSASDRLFELLVKAFGDNWSNDTLMQLLKEADHADKTLETWLREKFFTQHCKLFQHSPFIWHIWDGLRDGFAALVNYHRFDRKLLESLIYTYLGDWISRQKQDSTNGVDGAQEKLAAAGVLKKHLESILEGEQPHDIFVRWKDIDQQPIGWNPNLNDGVLVNIRPFMSVPDVGKRGAGVLRDKPNINWAKDRGKDVSSAPWYHLFKGDRINDHHLSLADKYAARQGKGKEPN